MVPKATMKSNELARPVWIDFKKHLLFRCIKKGSMFCILPLMILADGQQKTLPLPLLRNGGDSTFLHPPQRSISVDIDLIGNEAYASVSRSEVTTDRVLARE